MSSYGPFTIAKASQRMLVELCLALYLSFSEVLWSVAVLCLGAQCCCRRRADHRYLDQRTAFGWATAEVLIPSYTRPQCSASVAQLCPLADLLQLERLGFWHIDLLRLSFCAVYFFLTYYAFCQVSGIIHLLLRPGFICTYWIALKTSVVPIVVVVL